tara:strand:- start:1344 stop:1508 length:165 start_codon:yes stop_codon:yes gene_type:complete
MLIKLRKKNVYGIERFYPACEKSEVFADIAQKKTLDEYDIKKIKRLGVWVEVGQ